MTDSPTLVFGTYRLDVQNATLERGGRPVALTPKAFSVLHHLARHAGRLVTKEEFLDVVWPGVFVGDAALKVCVREIRKAIGEDPQMPTYIQTVHRRGYRFVAPVTLVTAPHADAPLVHDAPAGDRRAADAGGARRRPPPAASTDPLRAQRRRQHRLPGARRRLHRPGVRDGLGVAPRLLLARAVVRPLPHPAGLVLAPDPVRQARHRALGSGQRPADPRAADGRRPRGDGSGRLGARGADGRVGGRAAVQPVRHHLSGAHARPGDDRHLRAAAVGARLSARPDPGRARALHRDDQQRLGRPGGHRGARAEPGPRPRVPRLVEHLPADGRQPGRGGDADPDERRDRRPARAARRSACRRWCCIAPTTSA